MARGASRQASAAATPALGTDPGRPARVPLRPEIRPAWGPRRAARHTTPLPAEPRRPVTAWPAARRKQKGVFERDHSTARRQLRPGRRGHQSPTELTFAEQGQQQKQQPQPRGAGRRLRHRRCTHCSRGERDASSGWGAQRRGAVLSRAAPCPSRSGGRGEHCGRRASGRGLPGTLRSCARGSGRGTEAGRARAAPEARAGAGRGGEGGGLGAGRARPGCGGKGGARGATPGDARCGSPGARVRRPEPDAGRRPGGARGGARCGTRAPAWRPQPRAAHLRTHSHSSSACASSRCLCASTFPAAQRGQGNQAGMRGLGGLAGGAPERTDEAGAPPPGSGRGAHPPPFLGGGRCGGSAASLGAGGGRREEGRAPARDREPARLLRAPGVRLARGS